MHARTHKHTHTHTNTYQDEPAGDADHHLNLLKEAGIDVDGLVLHEIDPDDMIAAAAATVEVLYIYIS